MENLIMYALAGFAGFGIAAVLSSFRVPRFRGRRHTVRRQRRQVKSRLMELGELVDFSKDHHVCGHPEKVEGTGVYMVHWQERDDDELAE